MTSNQKEMILVLRNQGESLPAISKELNLPINIIKSFLYRHQGEMPQRTVMEQNISKPVLTDHVEIAEKREVLDQPVTSSDNCLFCGGALVHTEGKRKKKFCSDKCRMRWWYRNRNNQFGKSVFSFTCACCGRECSVYGNNHRKYCSQDCFNESRRGGKYDK